MARRWWTLVVVCTATVVLLLDVTVVNVALPAIEHDLGADFSELQWVIDAYAVTLAATLLTAGGLADRLGRRRVFSAGIAVFTASSLVCALAGSPLVLDLARGVQGLGAAAMFATSLALLAQDFHGRDRGVALGIWGAASGAAIAIGPLAGGAIVDGLGWEWIFLVNVPIGAVLAILTRARVIESRDPAAGAVDVPGVVTFSGGLLLLVFGLIRGNAEGWGSVGIVAALGGGAALLALFALLELRGSRPMLDLRLFRIPAFSGTAAVAFTQSVAIYPMFLFLALYFQDVLGYTPFETGVRVLPITLALFALAPLSGRLTARLGLRALLAVGLVLVGLGLVLMHGLEPGSDWTALLAGFVVGGAGMGIISPALAAAMVGVLPVERSGVASGINNTFRQVGIAAGIAGLGAVFQHRVTETVAHAFEGTGASSDRLAHLAGEGRLHDAIELAGPGGGDRVRAALERGVVDGLNEIFLLAAAVALVGALFAATLIRARDLSPQP
jgi:EmrB/QacA subfamily drug resistance transporter